ncbi:hypothetical protein APY03_1127 [Variovorax sp. WDL1]|nr:hypothetical protein APY03_1127 [Variovorax sp. WDL1]
MVSSRFAGSSFANRARAASAVDSIAAEHASIKFSRWPRPSTITPLPRSRMTPLASCVHAMAVQTRLA